MPGVTRIDVDAILKGRTPTQKPRGLIGWLSGEYEVAEAVTPPGTLEPPDEAVRREMLRLELAALEAEVLARQAEAVAEAATESGERVDPDDLGLDGPTAGLDSTAGVDDDDSAGDEADAPAGDGSDPEDREV